MAIVAVGSPLIPVPLLFGGIPSRVLTTARHAVYMKQRWADDDWEYIPYLAAQSATEGALPAGSSATLEPEIGRAHV